MFWEREEKQKIICIKIHFVLRKKNRNFIIIKILNVHKIVIQHWIYYFNILGRSIIKYLNK